MRIMGNASDVPIEPPEQTKLLDACCALPGVIGAGVPGGKLSLCSIRLRQIHVTRSMNSHAALFN
jgi:phosphomevalonate kinase